MGGVQGANSVNLQFYRIHDESHFWNCLGSMLLQLLLRSVKNIASGIMTQPDPTVDRVTYCKNHYCSQVSLLSGQAGCLQIGK